MVIGAGHELEGDVLDIQNTLQMLYCLPDLRTAVVVKARQDVGRAGDLGHTFGDKGTRHSQRHGQISRPVINARQDVAMQVDHVGRR